MEDRLRRRWPARTNDCSPAWRFQPSDGHLLDPDKQSVVEVAAGPLPRGPVSRPRVHVAGCCRSMAVRRPDLDLLLTKTRVCATLVAPPRSTLRNPNPKGRLRPHRHFPTFLLNGWSGGEAPICRRSLEEVSLEEGETGVNPLGPLPGRGLQRLDRWRQS